MKSFYLKPKFFSTIKNYSKEQAVKDIVAGVIVAIIALPLSIALALASGVEPACGVYTAIFAGFMVSFLGGSRVQIAGPTAAFATVVAGIVATQGMSGLIVATILAGNDVSHAPLSLLSCRFLRPHLAIQRCRYRDHP